MVFVEKVLVVAVGADEAGEHTPGKRNWCVIFLVGFGYMNGFTVTTTSNLHQMPSKHNTPTTVTGVVPGSKYKANLPSVSTASPSVCSRKKTFPRRKEKEDCNSSHVGENGSVCYLNPRLASPSSPAARAPASIFRVRTSTGCRSIQSHISS